MCQPFHELCSEKLIFLGNLLHVDNSGYLWKGIVLVVSLIEKIDMLFVINN